MTAWMPREGTAPPLSLPKVTAALSHEAASLDVQLQMERERADKAEARVRELENALRNVLQMSRRMHKHTTEEVAYHLQRFCANVGVVPSIMRNARKEARVRELEASQSGESHGCHRTSDDAAACEARRDQPERVAGADKDMRPTSELVALICAHERCVADRTTVDSIDFRRYRAACAELDRRLTADGCSRCRGER